MNTNKTEKFFHSLKAISPDEAYAARSKELILGTAPFPRLTLAGILARARESLRLGSALALTSILILLLLGGLPYLKATLPLRVAGIDPKVIQAEEREIQVTLSELAAYEDSGRDVRAALKESLREGPGQLSPQLLLQEAGETEPKEPVRESVDEALRALME